MSETIAFNVVGVPKPQPRPRATMRGAHMGVYDPGTAEGWRASVRVEAMRHKPARPIQGRVAIVLVFYMPRLGAHYRTGRRAGELKPNAPTMHTKKPDLDNLVKAVMDSLSDIGMWRDDSIVCELKASKVYGQPGCGIIITTNGE